MTNKTKSTSMRLELELERHREEGNWSKVIELGEHLRHAREDVSLAEFLIGEGRLENHLEECPPIDVNVNRAKLGTIEARRNLQLAINENGPKSEVAMDAHLLLGKLHYACGQYADGLHCLKSTDLLKVSEQKLPLRSLKIVAESFAVYGLCLQKDNSASSKFKKAERIEDMNRCFELASDLSLLYMQQQNEKENEQNYNSGSNTGTHSPLPPAIQKTLGVILEQGLQQAPIALLQQEKPDKALERYRHTLYAVETPGTSAIRLKFMCQLAELLLQGLIGDKYKIPSPPTSKTSIWKPAYYPSLHQFVPKNECEETILLLLIAESIAVKNTVLSQSPECQEVRRAAHEEATIVYDLLTLATVRWGQISLLQESLERAMKFSFEEVHLWQQHALSLISMGRHTHALRVLKEVIRLDPDCTSNYLLAAKLCYEHLNLIEEGTLFSIESKKREVNYNSGLLSRSYLYTGIGYYLQADACYLKETKSDLMESALDNFKNAIDVDNSDHLAHYYLALQLAIMGNITDAHKHAHISLSLRSESSSTFHLLILLLTAKRDYKNALGFVDYALEEYPDCLNLFYVKAHLELHEKGSEKALITAKQMLELWKNLYEGQISSDIPECDRKSDSRSVFQLYTSEMSDKDSSSLHLHNAAVTRVEQALSEVASSMSSFNPKPGPHRAWLLQMEIWLLLAELYLAMELPDEMQQCIQEATQIYPLSHHIMHMKGLLYMHKQEWSEAKLCFQNAVAINPQHVKSLQELGIVYHYLSLHGLAEMTLREAAKIEPKNHITWYNLGKVLEALGEYEKAADAMDNALKVENDNPILPFNSVPLCFE